MNEQKSGPVTAHKHGGLGQLAATAICGNDITSSCLYVSALAIIYGGRWAPICLLLVAGTLYLFRSIYAEVVGALPLNGGAYNALLNTTSKFRASVAACLTIISYMATAVISSNEAMHYLHSMWHHLPVILATIALLAVFMGLTIIGIRESSAVAIFIFLFHLGSMGLLMVAATWAVVHGGVDVLWRNLQQPDQGGTWHALFYGFAAAMLGISGFESSANFVEEQAEGVFPKTLRNMWVAVTILNPGMAFLALSLIPITDVRQVYQNTLLSRMAELSDGAWLAEVVGIDAVLVLSGATLTSFVGVSGLVERMTLDRCLPQFLLKKSRRGTPHRIVIVFFILCVSVLVITRGDLKSLAAVYTLSFLSVMALFAIGNLLLKSKRPSLPRPVRASYFTVLTALGAVGIAIWGNARLNTEYLAVFLGYFLPAMVVITIMLSRLQILEFLAYVLDRMRQRARQERDEAVVQRDWRSVRLWSRIGRRMRDWEDRLYQAMERIINQEVVFFTRGDNLRNLNRVMLYILENEHTNRVRVVTVVEDPDDVPPKLRDQLACLHEAYPELDIRLEVVQGKFSPQLIDELSKKWRIPKNFMFIGSPGDHFIYGLSDLGGVRLVI